MAYDTNSQDQEPEDQMANSSILEPTESYSEDDEEEGNLPSILKTYIESDNIADLLEEDKLQMIAFRVIAGVDEDKTTQQKWMNDVKDAQRLATLMKEPKNTPLPQSANIKYPLITQACYQFAARTYPEIIGDGKVVKHEIIGQPTPELLDEADLICQHMNYQLLGPDSSWEASMDKLLVLYANIGFICKKTFWNPLKECNDSLVINYEDLILRNAKDIHSLNDLRRITHIIYCHPNDLVENARYGLYKEETVTQLTALYSTSITNPVCELYEQHCFYDLDDDGYEEPYIVTMHKDTHKILRIVARYDEDDIKLNKKGKVKCITPIQYFTDFHFVPSLDGCFMSIGYGTLMLHLNETVNTLLNQLIDAGKLANLQTGIIDSRIKLMGGQTFVDPGMLIRAKGVIGQTLKDGIVPLNYKEPSQTLYSLLGMLIQASKELTSSTDALQGSLPAQNVQATTMLAMIEQGMKMYSAIQKRLYRSLKEEYHKLYRLNKMYCEPEDISEILGIQVPPDIYKSNKIRIMPIADPNISSDAQRLSQAQVIMTLYGKPGINNMEVAKRYLAAAKITNPAQLLASQNPKDFNAPDPNAVKLASTHQTQMGSLQIKSRAQDLKEKEFAAKLAKIEADITKSQAHAVKLVADADATHKDLGLKNLSMQLDAIKTHIQSVTQTHQMNVDNDIANKEMMLKQQNQQHSQQMDHINAQQGQQQIDNDQANAEQESAQQAPEASDQGQQNQETGSENGEQQ